MKINRRVPMEYPGHAYAYSDLGMNLQRLEPQQRTDKRMNDSVPFE